MGKKGTGETETERQTGTVFSSKGRQVGSARDPSVLESERRP
ncbi:hypothetical protein E2C01_096132 [Portunus trituberculatus]|uniref:Uncharacterized protein n=1 Tax=Portunus trituberculatus TaxID=210409 RepID=A0A5B7K7G8_PORTR|nr:hypothetical protein [Portunus trituberculatus]